MNPDEQKKMPGNSAPGRRKAALEMGVGFKNQDRQQRQRQQKRDACHDLDRLTRIVETENEAPTSSAGGQKKCFNTSGLPAGNGIQDGVGRLRKKAAFPMRFSGVNPAGFMLPGIFTAGP